VVHRPIRSQSLTRAEDGLNHKQYASSASSMEALRQNRPDIGSLAERRNSRFSAAHGDSWPSLFYEAEIVEWEQRQATLSVASAAGGRQDETTPD
jgi:hypothetical protein